MGKRSHMHSVRKVPRYSLVIYVTTKGALVKRSTMIFTVPFSWMCTRLRTRSILDPNILTLTKPSFHLDYHLDLQHLTYHKVLYLIWMSLSLMLNVKCANNILQNHLTLTEPEVHIMKSYQGFNWLDCSLHLTDYQLTHEYGHYNWLSSYLSIMYYNVPSGNFTKCSKNFTKSNQNTCNFFY